MSQQTLPIRCVDETEPARLREPPTQASRELSPSDAKIMRRIGVAMFVLGALNAYQGALSHTTTSDVFLQAVFATLLLIAAIVLSIGAPRQRLLRAAPIYGVTVLGAICATGRPLGGTPFFYMWPIMIAAYFFSRRYVIVLVSYMALTFGIVIALWADTPLKPVLYAAIVSTTGLVAAVVVVMREHQSRLVNQLYRASTTDWLTDLLNRRAFESALAREVQRANQSGLALSLVSFDLDHFKQCNDRYGHAAGDRLLRRFADLARLRCRPGDLVARVGGEEFAIVLFDTTGPEATDMATSFGRELIAADVADEPQMRFSAGVASLVGGMTPEGLMLAADRALYAAKQSGRERVAVWDGRDVHLGPTRYGLPTSVAGSAIGSRR